MLYVAAQRFHYDRRDTRDGKIRGGIYQEYPRYIPYHGYIPVYFVRYPRIMACRVCTRTAHDQVHCQYRLTWQSPMSKLAGSLGHLCWKTRTVIRRIRLRRHSNTRYMQYYNLNPGTTPPGCYYWPVWRDAWYEKMGGGICQVYTGIYLPGYMAWYIPRRSYHAAL